MAIINLRKFYPWYSWDEFVEVSDEVAEELFADKRYQRSSVRRIYRNKAQYSLDMDDGIENEVCFQALSPHEVYEYKLLMCQLCHALNSLPEKQGRRIDAYYILGMSITEIAKTEGVAKSRISESIELGLRNMKKYLEISFRGRNK